MDSPKEIWSGAPSWIRHWISPRLGRQLSGGRHQPMILPNFPKNCMQLKKIGSGGRVPCAPLDPPLATATSHIQEYPLNESRPRDSRYHGRSRFNTDMNPLVCE